MKILGLFVASCLGCIVAATNRNDEPLTPPSVLRDDLQGNKYDADFFQDASMSLELLGGWNGGYGGWDGGYGGWDGGYGGWDGGYGGWNGGYGGWNGGYGSKLGKRSKRGKSGKRCKGSRGSCKLELESIAELKGQVAELKRQLAACLATEGPTSGPTHAPSYSASIVFVTSESYTGGAFGGVEGAHLICQRLASDAGLSGVYKAWISSDSYSPASDFVQSSLPYVLVDGATVVANNWNDLVAPSSQCPDTGAGYTGSTDCLQNAIGKDEKGNAVSDLTVWTGTKADGTVGDNPVKLGFPDCNGWTSSEGTFFGLRGGNSRVDFRWSSANAFENAQENGPCSDSYRIYCFQQ